MPIQTTLTDRLNLTSPIIQAPMGGGATTVELVAAVCQTGALGCIGAAYLTAEQIAEDAQAIRAQTRNPFGINIFAPLPSADEATNLSAAIEQIAPYYAEVGLPPPTAPQLSPISFEERFVAALESGAALFSFTFGLLPSWAIKAVKERDIYLMGTATTVEEARILEAAGVDAVVAQGSEAGGHRGTFATNFEVGQVGTMALVPQMVDGVDIPVVASGGIMDGRGIAAALALGAAAVQMGTAFLTCEETGIAEAHKAAILAAGEQDTRLTRVFSGRPARGIANRFMDEMEQQAETILPYPLQNRLTRPLRRAAAQQGQPDYLSLWAGQGVRLARRQSAQALVAQLTAEMDRAIERLTGGGNV